MSLEDALGRSEDRVRFGVPVDGLVHTIGINGINVSRGGRVLAATIRVLLRQLGYCSAAHRLGRG